MSDTIIAGLAAAVVVAPLCAACILGPAVLASVFAGVTGLIGGLDPVVVGGLAVLIGVAAYGAIYRRRVRHTQASRAGETGR